MNTESNKQELVLVTGGAGFIAVHCMIKLLKEGYQVRATLRDLSREAAVRAMLHEGGVDAGDRLTFIKADLSSDENWLDVVKDCAYVMHVASPTPKLNFKHEDQMIIPAREGVLRVLRASKEAGSAFLSKEESRPPQATVWIFFICLMQIFKTSKKRKGNIPLL